jgi:hypothetical protein
MHGQRGIKIIDLEKYLVAIGFERAEIVLFVWVVGVAEIVVNGNCFDDAGHCFGAQGGDTGRNKGRTGAEVLAQFVIERTNGFGERRLASARNAVPGRARTMKSCRFSEWPAGRGCSASIPICGPVEMLGPVGDPSDPMLAVTQRPDRSAPSRTAAA